MEVVRDDSRQTPTWSRFVLLQRRSNALPTQASSESAFGPIQGTTREIGAI